MPNPDAPLYAGIVVEAPLTTIYHYRVPDELVSVIQPGDRALITFANRKTRGVVVALTPEPPLDPKLIRPLEQISPPEERVPPELLDLTRWTADYYHSSWGLTLAAAIPGAVKTGRKKRREKKIELAVKPEYASLEADKIARKAPRQAEALRAIVRWLADHPGQELKPGEEILNRVAPPAMQRLLLERGLIRLVDCLPSPPEYFPEKVKDILLTSEQNAAVTEMTAGIRAGVYQSFLLHGVTGSGKTEVYIRLIAETLAAGKGALVLVPEISLTPQTLSRFSRRFGDIAVLHSHLSDGERAEHWRNLCSGEVRLAVGARSAVFAPVRNLGLIVVDEEHERTYKQDNDPRYHARDVALVRGLQARAVVVLGSATPSLESLHNARIGKHCLLVMPTRPGGAKPPKVEIVDLKTEWTEVKKPTLFSRRLEYLLGECLRRREQAILFLNRRGFHTSVRCGVCGEAVECPNCDVALTHHRAVGLLRCGCCGHESGVPERCPTCGANVLRFVGTGTERVEDVLARLYPRARLLRMDSDSMSERDAHRRALSAFARGEYDVLLGTQMVAKGLDFPNVTLVGVLMADAALGMADFRAAERTFQLVTQVIGRAGRAGKEGLAVVQAFQPEHPAVACAVGQDFAGFTTGELSDREKQGYPPYRRLARLIFSGEKGEAVEAVARRVGEGVKAKVPPGGRVLGPVPCEVERLNGVYRWHMLLFTGDSRAMGEWLRGAEVKAGFSGGVRRSIDADPFAML